MEQSGTYYIKLVLAISLPLSAVQTNERSQVAVQWWLSLNFGSLWEGRSGWLGGNIHDISTQLYHPGFRTGLQR